MSTLDPDVSHELTGWFRARLDKQDIHFDAEPLSYEANTAYDIAFYRLQNEARDFWLDQYGYAPTPGQLTKAFFNAEFERFRTVREYRRHPWRRLMHRLWPSRFG